MTMCTLGRNDILRMKRTLRRHERRPDVRSEAGKQRVEQVVRQRVGVFTWSEALSEADRGTSEHPDP